MKHKNWIWALPGLFALSLWVWIVRLWSNFPAFMDTLEYVFPEKWFNVECFQKGLIPLWNPYIACGTPHVANFQSAAFYPWFWIWNWTGLTHWFFTLAILHGVIAAAGFYLWLRSIQVGPTPALLAALGWSGSAAMTLLWGFPTHLASLAWVPWVFWASEKTLDRPTVKNLLLLTAAWAFQLLAGYPIFSFFCLIFWAFYMFLHSGLTGKSRFFSAAGFLLAAGITACQWMPFIDLLGYMHREFQGGHPYNLRWNEYLTLFSPTALGIPGTAGYQGEYGNFIFGNFYLGWIPLALLGWGLISGKRRWSFWHGALIVTFLLPMGIHLMPFSFLDRWIDALEISKCSFLFLFAAFTLAALFLDTVLAEAKSKSWVRKWGWALMVLFMADLLSVPFRVLHPVPDPYQDPQVQADARRVRELSGDGRVLGLRTTEDVYSSSVTDLAGSFRETAARMTQNTNTVWGIRSVQGHLTTVVDGYQNLSAYLREGYPYDGRVLDAAGVKTIIASEPLRAFKYGSSERQENWRLIRNAGAMASGWAVDHLDASKSRAEALGNLLDPKAFLEDRAWIDPDPEGEPTALAPVKREGAIAPGSFCGLSFEIPAGASTAFVLDQCFAPGWHAWVDGQPVLVLRADGFWMAVVFQPGSAHRVVFEYSPLSFRLGCFISLLLICFLISLFFTLLRR